jgi:hypothetical protein
MTQCFPYALYLHIMTQFNITLFRYCQASMKVLKASGRAPELETWKQLFSSLEERIRTHQQVWPYFFQVIFALLNI